MRLAGERVPALVLLQSLKLAYCDVVPLKYAADVLLVLAQNLGEQREQRVLYALHADGKRLHDQKLRESIHRQAGEAVRFAEYHAAAAGVAAHDDLAVVPRVFYAALPECRVEAVVRVAGDEADANFAFAAEKAGAEVFALLAHRVHKHAVFGVLAAGDDLRLVYPWMPLLDPTRALRAYDQTRKFPL